MAESTSSQCISWIQWFCSLRGNEFLVEINERYLKDSFNLTGLPDEVPHFNAALEKILDNEPDEDGGDTEEEDSAVLERYAERLYGLAHARYVMTGPGLEAVLEKSETGIYGVCPRVYCNQRCLFPIGLSDKLDDSTVKVFCPACQDIYVPKHERHRSLPGAYFGTSLPQMMMMVYKNKLCVRRKPNKTKYEPRLRGFRLHQSAFGPKS